MPLAANHEALFADKTLVTAKIETTTGVDAAPTVVDNGLEIISCSVKPVINMIDIKRKTHYFSSDGAIPGTALMEFDFEVPLIVGVVNLNHFPMPEPVCGIFLRCGGFAADGQIDDDAPLTDSHAAVINVLPQKYLMVDSTTLIVDIDATGDETVTFLDGDFADPLNATAAEVAAVIDTALQLLTPPGSAEVFQGRIIISSDTVTSSTSIKVTGGTANGVLGFPTALVENYLIVNRWLYTPDSDACASTMTIYFYFFPACAVTDDQCLIRKVVGAVNNVQFMLEMDSESNLKVTGKGAYLSQETAAWAALEPLVNYRDGNVDSLIAIGASVEWDNYAGATRTDIFSKMEINLNWDVKERKSQATGTHGIHAFYITRDGSVTGSYDPEEVVTAVYDRWQDVFDATRQGLVGIWASPAGSQLTINAPNGQLGNPGVTADGILKHEQPFYLRDNNDDGDNYMTVLFDYAP